MTYAEFVRNLKGKVKAARTTVRLDMEGGEQVKARIDGVLLSSLQPAHAAEAIEANGKDVTFRAVGTDSNGKRDSRLSTGGETSATAFADQVRENYGLSATGAGRRSRRASVESNGAAEVETVSAEA